jgi:hypothetical protein
MRRLTARHARRALSTEHRGLELPDCPTNSLAVCSGSTRAARGAMRTPQFTLAGSAAQKKAATRAPASTPPTRLPPR